MKKDRKPMSEATKEKLRQKALERKLGQKELKTEEAIDISNIEVVDSKPIKGLGDVVEKITKFFGIEPCGECIKRKEWMNQFQFFKLRTEPTFDDVALLRRVTISKKVEQEDKQNLFSMYNRLFATNLRVCNCPGTILGMVETLNEFIDINKLPSAE